MQKVALEKSLNTAKISGKNKQVLNSRKEFIGARKHIQQTDNEKDPLESRTGVGKPNSPSSKLVFGRGGIAAYLKETAAGSSGCQLSMDSSQSSSFKFTAVSFCISIASRLRKNPQSLQQNPKCPGIK